MKLHLRHRNIHNGWEGLGNFACNEIPSSCPLETVIGSLGAGSDEREREIGSSLSVEFSSSCPPGCSES